MNLPEPTSRSHQPTRRALLVAGAAALSGCASTTSLLQADAAAGASQTGAWQAVTFPGKALTTYRRDVKDGVPAWRAEAHQSASMWRHRVSVEPGQFDVVRFSWWVDRLVPGAALGEAGRTDSPARLVFAFAGDDARLSMRNRMLFDLAESLGQERPPYATLVYAWSNDLPVGTAVVHPRSDRVRKIVIESGDAHLRTWRQHERRLSDDFQQLFGEAPGPLVGVALMTDSDNLEASALTWYGPVEVPGQAGSQGLSIF